MKKLSMLLASGMLAVGLAGCTGETQPAPVAPATPAATTGDKTPPKDEKATPPATPPAKP